MTIDVLNMIIREAFISPFVWDSITIQIPNYSDQDASGWKLKPSGDIQVQYKDKEYTFTAEGIRIP